MAGSYDPALPTLRDELRQELGDIGDLLDANNEPIWLYPDETYDHRIEKFGYNEGGARLAEGLAARFGSRPTEYDDEGNVRVKWADRAATWLKLADRLRAKASVDVVPITSNYASAHGAGGADVSGIR